MDTLPHLPAELVPLINALHKRGIRPILVGGYVRDALLGCESMDIDIECFGIGSLDALAELLSPFGSVNAVGKSFGVLKLKCGAFKLDLSLPRTETKTGLGHNGFDVHTFDRFDFNTAAKRRDFTINAVGYDPVRGVLLDPYGGKNDLESRVLRCVDEDTFVEDPLRLLRAVQFSARFELTPDKQLVTLAHKMVSEGVLGELPVERIFEEIKKLLLKAEKPSWGLRTMDALNITPFFPELDALHHRHWDDTLASLDAMVILRDSVDTDLLGLMLGTLCLNMDTEQKVMSFLARLTNDKKLNAIVLGYYRNRDAPERLYRNNASDVEIMMLACRIRIDALCAVANARHLGRNPRSAASDAAQWLYINARKLGVLTEPKPALLGGNDLIAAGLSPSPAFKTILDTAYRKQLEGAFGDKNGAKSWLHSYLSDLG